MIARPHICLRCQLRLARRPVSRVRFHTIDSKRSAYPSAARSAREDDEEFQPFPAVRRPLGLGRTASPPADVLKPLGERLYGHLGNKLRDDRERLDIDALGQPAEVIVLRDSKLNYYAHSKVIDSEEQEKVDILKQLDSERGLIGQAEVEANINEFRPKDGSEPKTWEDFNVLVEALQEGFTTSQLVLYIKNNLKGTDQSEVDVHRDNLTRLRCTPWLPDFAQTTADFGDNVLRGYFLESHTAKQGVVIRLLRECWKLSLAVLQEGIGQIEAHLAPRDLDFLLQGSQSLLSEISTHHISDEQEKVEAFRSRSVIRITAPRTKAYAIVRDVEDTVKRIRRVEVSLLDLLPQSPSSSGKNSKRLLNSPFEDITLHEVGRLTDTDIFKQTKDKLVISCFQEDDSTRSNQAEVARNLLAASIRPSNRMSYSLDIKQPVSLIGAFVKYPSTEGLGWRDRLREWTRWTVPIEREIDQLLEASTPSTSHDAGRVTDNMKWARSKPQDLDVDVDRDLHWSVARGTSASVLVGSVLHSHASNASAESRIMNEVVLRKTVRGFSTRVPNLTQLMGSMGTERWRPISSVVLRLLPSPFQNSTSQTAAIGTAALCSFPPVEMRLRVNEKNGELATKIQAIFREEVDDLMLPDRAVDLRFLRRWTSHYYPEADPSVQRFLDDSILDFVRGFVETPATLTLPISKHLCRENGFELLREGSAVEELGIAPVEYLVVGLEKRSTVPLKFNGWDLLYTSIDAGKAGGRRSELKLLPKLDNSPNSSHIDFVAASHQLVDLLSDPHLLTKARKVTVKKPMDKDESWADGGIGLVRSATVLGNHNFKEDGDPFSENTFDDYFVDRSL